MEDLDTTGSASGDELLSTVLKARVQLYQSQARGYGAAQSAAGGAPFLSQIGGTLALLEESLAELKTCMNAIRPVFRLPSEVLSLVFRSLSRKLPAAPRDVEYFESCVEGEEESTLFDWIKVTHVSRHFHQVALNDPTLWTDIYTKNGKSWTKVFFDRCGSRDTTLHLGDCLLRDIVEPHPFWKQAISRAHTLQLGKIGIDWRDNILQSDSTALVNFRITLPSPPPDPDESDLQDYIAYPFFEDNPAGLRELQLYGFLFYRFSTIITIPSLTILKLGTLLPDQTVELDEHLPSVLDTLSLLQNLESLALLGLENSEEWTEKQLDQCADTVVLPHLRHMRFECCSPSTLFAFYNAISPSDDAKVHIGLKARWWSETCNDTDTLVASMFLRALQRRIAMPAWQTLQTVMVSSSKYTPKSMPRAHTVGASKSFGLSAWREELDPHRLFNAQEPDFHIGVSCRESSDEHKHHATGMLRCFSALPIRTMCLLSDHSSPWSPVQWGSVSSDFTALRHVLACSDAASEEILVLFLHPLTLYPELKKLSFLHSDDGQWARGDTQFQNPSTGAWYTYAQLLERVHSARRDHGPPTSLFVDSRLLDSGAFDSISDKSILQRVSFPGSQ